MGLVFRYALLLAPCQSGKTGTFHALARLAISSGLVDCVILVCGSSEIVLRDQAYDDAQEYNEEFLRSQGGNPPRFQIIFHGDFGKKTFNRRRCLIIVDESHLDQGKNQKMKEFLFANGIDLWGTTDRMIAEQTFILSVSATPYSELSDIYHGITPRKAIVELTPGPGYKGVGDYWYSGHVHETFSIMENFQSFVDIVKSKGRRWNLIRCHGASDNSLCAFIHRNAASAGLLAYEYTQDKRDVAITKKERHELRSTKRVEVPCLEDEPDMPSIVILKGKLRAGKVVPKVNIGLVWEDSKSPSTDTIVQSLLGRMCGYEFGAHLPDIYLSPKMVMASKSLIKQNNIVRHTMMPLLMPMKGRNVKGAALPSAEGHVRHPCVPLLLRFAEMEREYEDEDALQALRRYETCNDATSKQFLMKVLKANDCARIKGHAGLSPDQKTELMAALLNPSTVIGIRHFHPGVSAAHMNFLDTVAQAQATGSCPLERLAQDTPFGFLIYHAGLRHVGTERWTNPTAGDVFVYFNTGAKGVGFMGKQSLKARIPQTTGNEIFRCRLSHGDIVEPEVAGVSLRFSSAVCDTPAVFKESVRSVLAYQKSQEPLGEDGVVVNPVIKGLANGKAMRIKKSLWDETYTVILRELAAEFGVEFTVNYGITTPDVKTVKMIRWV